MADFSVAEEIRALAPTLGFLAAVLVLADLCAREGLFAAAGRLLAGHADGRARHLLAYVFALAAVVTAVLGLDATIVLLTPVVLNSVLVQRLRPRPHLYACVHLANAASLLLPVSNLTNLLAFHESGISFLRFTALMVLPWIAVIALEWLAFTRFFAQDLATGPAPAPAGGSGSVAALAHGAGAAPTGSLAAAAPRDEERGSPLLAAAVVAATLAGFVLSTPLEIDPAIIAGAGAVVLAVPALASGRTTPAAIVKAASPWFLLAVLALGVLVAGALSLGLDDAVDEVVPHGDGLLALLAVTGLAALLANAINNLPATLILLPALADRGTGPLLAMLIGVNVGPNLTYTGSLATLLWKRVLRGSGEEPAWPAFWRLGVATVPLGLAVATALLWAGLQV
ncbi:MAG TPA: SLC13 family permease [Conexibacter sp.]|jgi:arsenical pump membrane protein